MFNVQCATFQLQRVTFHANGSFTLAWNVCILREKEYAVALIPPLARVEYWNVGAL